MTKRGHLGADFTSGNSGDDVAGALQLKRGAVRFLVSLSTDALGAAAGTGQLRLQGLNSYVVAGLCCCLWGNSLPRSVIQQRCRLHCRAIRKGSSAGTTDSFSKA